LSKEEKAKIKEEIAWQVDGIINFVNDNSWKFVKYASQAKYLLKKLWAVKSLLKQDMERRENQLIETDDN
jgi:hypothetical protein